MIQRIFINGVANYRGKQAAELPMLENHINEIGVEFDTFDSAEKFVSQFPKSYKIRVSNMTSWDFENKVSIKHPYVRCWRTGLTDVTGDKNEGGDKKMNRFYKELSTII